MSIFPLNLGSFSDISSNASSEFLISSSNEVISFFASSNNEEGVPSPLGICIGSPQTKEHFEKGSVIKKESQDFNLKFLDDQKPIGIIGTLEAFAILIIPSETISLGPLGPSGVIPIQLFCCRILNIGFKDIALFLLDISTLFNLKYL